MQASRAVINWDDGSVRSTEWLADDGSQEVVDRMVEAVVAIVNQRPGERCAIKWERREVRRVSGRDARSGSPVESGLRAALEMVSD
jgi:hypothetical protein